MDICRCAPREGSTGTRATGTPVIWAGTLVAVWLTLPASGCRTPWRAASEQPDFNRLMEIEQQQLGHSGPARESLSARHRPGGQPGGQPGGRTAATTAASRNASAPLDEPAEFAELDRDNPGVTASLSDRDESDDILADVPPAERELLRREMSALRARTATDNPPRSPSAAEGLTSTSRRYREPDDAADDAQSLDPSYTANSRYQLAAEADAEDHRVPPRAVDPPYRRNLSDAPPANELAESRPAADVVSASYSQPSPAGRVNESTREPSAPAAASPGAGSPAAGPSASDPAELTWREHIYRALEQLEQAPPAASPEEQVQRHMSHRLLHLSLGDINAASEPIEGLQPQGQDFIRHSLEALYEVGNPAGNPVESKRYTLAMLSQRKAMTQLAAVSNLEVRNAAFCTEVDGFGVVTRFPQYTFKADQELLLYCEMDNFVSTAVDSKGFETQLQGSYEIVDASGRRVADQLLPLDSHVCRNQRRDYFIAYRIYMPPQIDPGKYQLKLTVEDLKGRKFGQAVLDFQISQ